MSPILIAVILGITPIVIWWVNKSISQPVAYDTGEGGNKYPFRMDILSVRNIWLAIILVSLPSVIGGHVITKVLKQQTVKAEILVGVILLWIFCYAFANWIFHISKTVYTGTPYIDKPNRYDEEKSHSFKVNFGITASVLIAFSFAFIVLTIVGNLLTEVISQF